MVERVDYVFVIPGNTFTLDFLISWSKTLDYLNEKKITYRWAFRYHPNISIVRNTLFACYLDRKDVSTKLDTYSPVIFKKIVTIDSDIVWHPFHLERLINSPHPVTTGIYSFINQKYAVLMKDNYSMYSYEELKTKKDYFEVDMCGLGFMACDYEVVSQMSFPWFNSPYIDKEDFSMTEDRYFCNKLRDMGYKIYADANIHVGHQKQVILNGVNPTVNISTSNR